MTKDWDVWFIVVVALAIVCFAWYLSVTTPDHLWIERLF